jgi:hypothetical protein
LLLEEGMNDQNTKNLINGLNDFKTFDSNDYLVEFSLRTKETITLILIMA